MWNRGEAEIDAATVRRIAELARIDIDDGDIAMLTRELSSIVHFVDALGKVDVTDASPLSSLNQSQLRVRADRVTDGDLLATVLENGPHVVDDFFVVPQVHVQE